MGCCLGRSGASDSDDLENAITIGKNRPLIQERIKWKSDVPMTDGQLRSKRDEFWETAPAFEGRKEIWDALRAASALAEQGDYALSQAILDGANISLPDGTLRESYDELGNRYQVPYYCLSAPTNLIEEHSSESSGATINGGGDQLVVANGKHGSNSSAATDSTSTNRPGTSSSSNQQQLGEPIALKLRLSTSGEDINVDCYSRENIHTIKQRLHVKYVDQIPPASQQRWFFGGRILLDKMKIGDCRIPQNFVVQLVINTTTAAVVAKSGGIEEETKKKSSGGDRSEVKSIDGGGSIEETKSNGRTTSSLEGRIDHPTTISTTNDASGGGDQSKKKRRSAEKSLMSSADRSSRKSSAKKSTTSAHTKLEKSTSANSSSTTIDQQQQPHIKLEKSKSDRPNPPLIDRTDRPNSSSQNVALMINGQESDSASIDRKAHHHQQKQKSKSTHSTTASAGNSNSNSTTGGNGNTRVDTTGLLQQQQPRCNSFNSKRSNESPTPVETS